LACESYVGYSLSQAICGEYQIKSWLSSSWPKGSSLVSANGMESETLRVTH
jgi:hypothetical protein